MTGPRPLKPWTPDPGGGQGGGGGGSSGGPGGRMPMPSPDPGAIRGGGGGMGRIPAPAPRVAPPAPAAPAPVEDPDDWLIPFENTWTVEDEDPLDFNLRMGDSRGESAAPIRRAPNDPVQRALDNMDGNPLPQTSHGRWWESGGSALAPVDAPVELPPTSGDPRLGPIQGPARPPRNTPSGYRPAADPTVPGVPGATDIPSPGAPQYPTPGHGTRPRYSGPEDGPEYPTTRIPGSHAPRPSTRETGFRPTAGGHDLYDDPDNPLHRREDPYLKRGSPGNTAGQPKPIPDPWDHGISPPNLRDTPEAPILSGNPVQPALDHHQIGFDQGRRAAPEFRKNLLDMIDAHLMASMIEHLNKQ